MHSDGRVGPAVAQGGAEVRVQGMRPLIEDRAQIRSRSVYDATSLLRMEVGTLASGNTARMTGSASAMTSSGIR